MPTHKTIRIVSYSLILLNAAAIAAFWWMGSSSNFLHPWQGSVLIAFGRLSGLLAATALLFQLVLIGRIRFLENAFGFPAMNRLHRTVGMWLVSTIVLHPLLLVYGYAGSDGLSAWGQFLSFLRDWENVAFAFVALVLIIVVGLLSARMVRSRVRYESWHAMHLFMYVSVALAFFHQLETGDLAVSTVATRYWIGLNLLVGGCVVAYRFVRPVYLFYRHRFVVDEVVEETPDVVSLVIRGRHMEKFRFDPGQYASIIVLNAMCWTPHPFSFSSIMNGETIRFSIKELGDYTKRIRQIKKSTHVIIDGPMGAFTASHAETNRFVFLAGGIGITPIFSILQELQKKNAEAVLLYATADDRAVLFRDEIRELAKNWPNFRHAFFIATPSNGATPYTDGLPFEKEYYAGFLNQDVLSKFIPNPTERNFFICGPAKMLAAMEQCIAYLHVPKKQVHHEKFAF